MKRDGTASGVVGGDEMLVGIVTTSESKLNQKVSDESASSITPGNMALMDKVITELVSNR